MKRSEALALIDKVYGDWVADVLRSNLETDNFIALNERILSALEQVGMLPPLCKATIATTPSSIVDAVLDSVVDEFKWDTEDEQT